MTREGIIKEDAEDDNQGRLCHGERIVDWVSCWSGSPTIGVSIAATSATKWKPKTAEMVVPFLSLRSWRCQCRSTGHLQVTQCVLNSMENTATGTLTQDQSRCACQRVSVQSQLILKEKHVARLGCVLLCVVEINVS
jgi:hypothetical protein